MPVELPDPLNALVLDLLDSYGMRELRRREHEAFGNCYVDLANEDILVRIVRDRGQWFVCVADVRRQGRWYDVWQLQPLLGRERPKSTIPVDEQARFVREHLSILQDAFSTQNAESTHAKLEYLASQRIG